MNINNKPDFVLAPLWSTSDGKTVEVIAVKYGETGYYKTDWGRQTLEWISEYNMRSGIEAETAIAYETCSLFGNWVNYENVFAHVQEAIKNHDRKVEAAPASQVSS